MTRQPIVIQILALMGKILPRKLGLGIAALIGTCLGSLKQTSLVKAIRANQWVIHDQKLSKKALNQLPRVVFRSASKCFFDYFYFLNRPEKLEEMVRFSPEAQAAIQRIKSNEACVVVCPHLSNFDLMG